jgi:hypothetical protein
MKLDHSVYPDLDPDQLPTELTGDQAKADYVHRICSQWDYGIVPDEETFELFHRWKSVFDRLPVGHSPAYHAFRAWFGWKAVPARLLRATYEFDDLKEGRTDPCEGWIQPHLRGQESTIVPYAPR